MPKPEVIVVHEAEARLMADQLAREPSPGHAGPARNEGEGQKRPAVGPSPSTAKPEADA